MLRRWQQLGAIGVVLTTLVACADQIPMAPDSAQLTTSNGERANATASIANSSSYAALTRSVPLATDMTASAWIYPSRNAYQSVKIQDAGVKVSFPPGAVTSKIYVTIVAHKGSLVTYEFLPHGTTFYEPVKIQQDLHGTNAYQNEAVMSNLIAGYMENGLSDVDYSSGTVTFAETFPIYYWDETTDYKKTTPSVAKFYTYHFSGYALASGRTTDPLQ